MLSLPKWMVTFKHSPPDAGWSWIVLAGGFVCNAIMEGTLNSFGMFYPALVHKFGLGNRGVVAWAGALLAGSHNLAGSKLFLLFVLYFVIIIPLNLAFHLSDISQN